MGLSLVWEERIDSENSELSVATDEAWNHFTHHRFEDFHFSTLHHELYAKDGQLEKLQSRQCSVTCFCLLIYITPSFARVLEFMPLGPAASHVVELNGDILANACTTFIRTSFDFCFPMLFACLYQNFPRLTSERSSQKRYKHSKPDPSSRRTKRIFLKAIQAT